jgi:AraC-like DNA-binding protein
MALSRVSSFDDPGRFQAALHGDGNEVFVTSGRDFRAELTQVELSRMRLQRCAESLPTIRVGALPAGQFGIAFLTDPEQPDFHHCGLAVRHGDVIVDDLGSMHRRSGAPCRWGSLSMRAEDLAAVFAPLSGHDLRSPRTHVTRPGSIVFSELAQLHASAGRMAGASPGPLDDPGATRALDAALATALAMCLIDGNEGTVRVPCGRSIIARLEEFLALHHDEPIYVAELCAATHATERMLRVACHEHLGMGAFRYLWLRRMHLAHRLFLWPARDATVTGIATRCGFWELGRFSVQYQALFGEAPSISLHRAAREHWH